MELTTRRLPNCDIVAATGRVDAYTSPQLEGALAAITDAGRFRIVFDMSGVEHISSFGLRALADAQKVCKRFGQGWVVLAGPKPLIRWTLQLAGSYLARLCIAFEVYDTVVEAIGNV